MNHNIESLHIFRDAYTWLSQLFLNVWYPDELWFKNAPSTKIEPLIENFCRYKPEMIQKLFYCPKYKF